MEFKIESGMGAVSAVMQALYWTVVVMRGLWVVAKRVQTWVQASEIRLVHRLSG